MAVITWTPVPLTWTTVTATASMGPFGQTIVTATIDNTGAGAASHIIFEVVRGEVSISAGLSPDVGLAISLIREDPTNPGTFLGTSDLAVAGNLVTGVAMTTTLTTATFMSQPALLPPGRSIIGLTVYSAAIKTHINLKYAKLSRVLV